MNQPKKPVFVIQQHDATNLHYDFRIEVEGALASWAVPKGLSTDPRDKRLAIRTADHDMAYADFEGVIPASEYGAGTVIVWDAGSYENKTTQDGEVVAIGDALDNGHAAICLHGRKLSGGYVLQRIKKDGDKQHWLVIKQDDEYADARRNPVSTEPESVKSGKTIEQVADEVVRASSESGS
jgi:DNA ligase D-like protein (predicted 3'-phosphoesterase)